MTPERWAQIEEAFHRAVEFDGRQRDLLLDQACQDDFELRREVEALLSSDSSARGRLQAAVDSEIHDFGFLMTGEVVSHYRILDLLGGGGMGLVYRAEDIKLGRQVALKFLPEDLATDPAALARFEREARAASALEHANICPIYEFGEHEGRAFLVMQLLQGQTLRELLETDAKNSKPGSLVLLQSRRPLPLDQVLDLGIQIAKGLEAAHLKGIIHRDVKPANIFVTSLGEAKILDFGLAKLAPNATDEIDQLESNAGNARFSQVVGGSARRETLDAFLSRTGVAMGTAGYMSPEQVRGEKLDARSDIFSFGLIVYEMATGRRAIEGTGPELHRAVLTQEPLPVRELNPKLPGKLEQIISKALEKSPVARYQSVSELREQLENLQVEPNHRRLRMLATFAVTTVLLAGTIRWATTHFASTPWLQAGTGKIIAFDAPGAGTGPGEGTIANQNNRFGVIAGYYIDSSGVDHGFVRDAEGNFATFDAPGAGTISGSGTSALGINDAGIVVGQYRDDVGADHGFLRTPDSTITTFDPPGAGTGCGPGCHNGTRAGAINLAGEIFGYIIDASGRGHGFLRSPNGTFTTFDPPDSAFTDADTLGIDLAGAITGPYFDSNSALHGFVRAPDGTITEFDGPGAGTGPGQGTIPGAISPTGTVAGGITDANGVQHGFLRAPGGTITTFDVVDAGTGLGQRTSATATNQTGITTGIFIDANSVSHGFIRTSGGQIRLFDAPGAGTRASQGTSPLSINEPGNITGYYVDASGAHHGFVRIPYVVDNFLQPGKR